MNKTSLAYKSIKPIAQLISEGKLLCVDPSSGSRSSLPGFAVYENGHLLESGVIEVDPKLNRSLRLFEIARTIREDFEEADALIVEYVPAVTFKGGSNLNATSLAALHKGQGAIIGARPFEHLVEIPAGTWRHHKPEGYIKTDEWDAIALGNCALNIAHWILENDQKKAKGK